MRKERLVTRTFTTTTATVMCANVTTAGIEMKTVTLSRKYDDEKDEMKAVNALLKTATIIPVKVVSREIVEELYGMTEQEFLSIARKLPPRSSQNDSEEED